jgi:hypothetical protein
MGPITPRTYAGQVIVAAHQRGKREVDYGRRGYGFVFGAFNPHTGECFTATYNHRTIPDWIDFLVKVEAWVPQETPRIIAIQDGLSAHHSMEVLLFNRVYPRWEFMNQPSQSAYLNLIEPWWKILRSLALKGRKFKDWADLAHAIDQATSYWNKHRHPFRWGQRRKRNRRSITNPRKLGERFAA